MPKIEIGPFITSIVVALVLFAIGRFLVIQMEDAGRWVVFASLTIFYAVWWVSYRRSKKRK